MKIIDKKNFFPIVCIIFTILVLGKILLEAAVQKLFGGYQQNILLMFAFSLLGTLVLSQHYRFQRFPLLAVIIVQYLVLTGAVMGVVWAASLFEPVHENGYRDMFLSFSIPYGIAAAVYYISFFHEVRCVNQTLEKIRRNQNAQSE